MPSYSLQQIGNNAIVISPTRQCLPSTAGDVSLQSELELPTDRMTACPVTHTFNTHRD